jgi:hypothetical protein
MKIEDRQTMTNVKQKRCATVENWMNSDALER